MPANAGVFTHPSLNSHRHPCFCSLCWCYSWSQPLGLLRDLGPVSTFVSQICEVQGEDGDESWEGWGRLPDESLATRGSHIWSHLDRSSMLAYRPMNENQLPPYTLGKAGLNLLLCRNKQTTELMATFCWSFLREGTSKKRTVWEICCLDRSLLLIIPLEIRFEIFMYIIHFKQKKEIVQFSYILMLLCFLL